MSRRAPYRGPFPDAVRILAAAFLALALAGVPRPGLAREPATVIYSIQVGTFAVPDNALAFHARLRKALPPAVADQLRLERIGSLTVLRLGRAAAPEDLEPLLQAVHGVVDNPRVMAVQYRPERFLVPPRDAGPAASRPAVRPAPAREYAVQAACYTDPGAAEKAFLELREALPAAAADHLRLEANGDLYVLRLGRATTPEALGPLVQAVRAAGESPEVLAAAYRPERFLIPPRDAAAKAVSGGAPARPLPDGSSPVAPAAEPAVSSGSVLPAPAGQGSSAADSRPPAPEIAPAGPTPPAPAPSPPVEQGRAAPAPAAVAPAIPASPTPVPAAGREFTVQAACYTEPQAAEKAFLELREVLPAAAADQLRLEANGDLYVLRLGRATTPEALEPLVQAVRAAGESPEILVVRYRPERFLVPPRGPAAKAASGGAPAGQAPEATAPLVPVPSLPVEQGRVEPAAPAVVSAVPASPTPAAVPASAPVERLPEVVATGYSVQLGSYASQANALAAHARLLAALPPDLADQLRLERVGIYHVLRLGLAPTREEMLPVLERVRVYVPVPVVLAAAMDPDRWVVPPRNLGREAAPAPAPAPAPVVPLAPAPAVPPAPGEDAAAPLPEEPLPPLPAFGATVREQELMQARIATRTGRFPQGQKLYEKLLAEHPGDEEILEQYVDALVDAMEYDLARQLLADWTKRAPDNPRPLRLTGLMFVRAGEFERSYAAFEDLLTRDPGDIGVMADLGFAKLGGGDWRHALELFSAVADEQPENETATQVVQEILMAHRPRLSSGLNTELRADDAVLITQSNGLSAPLSDQWALDLKYDLVHVDRPSKDTQEAIEHTVQDWMLTTRVLLDEDLTAFLGLGAVSGIGDRMSQQAGLEWQAHRTGRVVLLVERNRPWLDRVDATRYEGFQDHASLAYDALFDDRWGVYLAAERFRYTMLEHEYGRRNLGTVRLTRRLGWKPNVWAGYAYSFGTSEYDEDAPRIAQGDVLVLPVSLDREEESHSWFLTMDERACRNIRLLLSGGAGQNTISGNVFYFGSAEVLLEVSNRLTVRLGAGHNSDKSSVGGETTTYALGIVWIF